MVVSSNNRFTGVVKDRDSGKFIETDAGFTTSIIVLRLFVIIAAELIAAFKG
jgi:hypothetical protein